MKVINELENSIKNNKSTDFLSNLSWEIRTFGGRKLVHKDTDFTGTLCLNKIIKKFSLGSSQLNSTELSAIVKKIEELDKEGNSLLAKSSFFKRATTTVRRFFGNFNSNRSTKLNDLRSFKNTYEKLVQAKKAPNLISEVEKVDQKTLKDLQAYCKSDPFIHGTSSVIFAQLPYTDQRLVSIWELLQKKMAPIGGEIILGGLNIPIADGATCFGRLNSSGYPLSRVTESYSRQPNAGDIQNDQEAQKALALNFAHALEDFYFTQSLIFAIRAKQRGITLIIPEKADVVKSALQSIKCTFMNFYLFAPFIGKFVQLDPSRPYDDIQHAHFLEKCEEFLRSDQIDLAPYMDLEVLPENDEAIIKLNRLLNENGYQLLHKRAAIRKGEASFPFFENSFFHSFYGIGNLSHLWGSILMYPDKFLSTMDEIQERLNPFLEKARKHFDLLEEVLFGCEELTFTEEQKQHINDAYPIILISNQSEAFKPVKTEFRAKQGLQLGKEIKWIATERSRIKDVRAYLEKYRIEGVNVISIDTLRQYTKNC
ncbi:hypothetical protein [Parachlamydia acanthamoebae]|uniref:hypothetical protein n=1 Tax=Parachlamydia acanthamoebae TaxID=83552 RepID=UPI0007507D00|nr:hypothetical protein [Parachlamydia acanthamoebae]